MTQYKCETCHTSFASQEEVAIHEEEFNYFCEQCGLCFPSELSHDLHEHEQHPKEYFEVNKLTPRSKQRAIQYLNQFYK